MIKLILFLLGMVASVGKQVHFLFVKLLVVVCSSETLKCSINWSRLIVPVQFVKPTDLHLQWKCCTCEHLISRMVGFAKLTKVLQ